MLTRQAKERKIRKMLKKVNFEQLKIVILKNWSKKTHFEISTHILFVNPKVKTIVEQILKEIKKSQNTLKNN
ncbi:hypothetical Protein psc1_04140 [Candidatus Phytoplasma solani]|uniref:Uncharacterized protein n=2 Tax=Candidatus Phytoplasma solani TaxID=69896 RepID=A0A421NV37_9MOLU|nr:hypothetical protein [Candidatus Phytoplasma solani]RMI87845.1 hypothetical protein PSSA1_v1c5380 [Candidatus Phytoplasma solani]CCP88029.1 conserved hypothetical protein [Candidatus Phytoplasma solani]CCP88816.1 conserved hypothetical protein [Candidatus Phytoplasma solani]